MPTLGSIKLSQPIDPDVGLKQLDVVEDAKRAILEKGFRVSAKPNNGFDGSMPTDLTSLDDNHLGDLLNRLSEWCGYTQTELVQAKSDAEAAEARLELIQSHIRIAIKATIEGKITTQDKTDLMNTDPRVVQAKSRYLYCYTVYEYVKSFRDQAERNWDTVSRRITQRGQDIERMKRGENISTSSGTPLRSPFRR